MRTELVRYSQEHEKTIYNWFNDPDFGKKIHSKKIPLSPSDFNGLVNDKDQLVFIINYNGECIGVTNSYLSFRMEKAPMRGVFLDLFVKAFIEII